MSILGMITLSSLEIVKIFIQVLKVAIPVIAVVFILKTNWVKYFESIAVSTEKKISDRLKTQNGYFSYERISDVLKKKGITFLFGEAANPFTYLVVKFLCALICLALGISLQGILLGIIFAALGFFVPDLIVNLVNDIDNDEMMPDIKAVYDTLKIQAKSGVYLSYSLCECYMIVEHPRLKRALLDMTSSIIAKNQIETAVNEFGSKFENSYIDTLCVTILQSLESGKSTQVLEDISTQIADMQRAINIKEKEALDRRVQIFEMLIFSGVIAIMVYILGLSVFTQLATI